MKPDFLEKPWIDNDYEDPVLFVPYDVEFDYNGKHYSMRLINNWGVEKSILDKRNELLQRGKTPRGRTFCLTIDETGPKVLVYTFSEKAFDYYHSDWVSKEFCNFQGNVENLQCKPTTDKEQLFKLENVWDADGNWGLRSDQISIWKKAREIYPESLSLGVLKAKEVVKVVENLIESADTKFREIGATDDEVSAAPDYSYALVEYIGTTSIPVKNMNDWISPVLFSEGNPEIGFNAIIDLASLDWVSKALFTTELCNHLDYVGEEYVLEDVVKKAIDPDRIGTVNLYVGPNESIAKAYKRKYIDPYLQFSWNNEWTRELAHQKQLKSFASEEVKKAQDEFQLSYEILADIVEDKELLATTMRKLKETGLEESSQTKNRETSLSQGVKRR